MLLMPGAACPKATRKNIRRSLRHEGQALALAVRGRNSVRRSSMVDVSLGYDPSLNVQGITAAAQPGAVVNLPGGTYPVDGTIKVNGASVVGGVGGTTLAVSRDALPTEIGPNVYRVHLDIFGACTFERVKVVGRNLSKLDASADPHPGINATEFEHAWRVNSGASVALLGCSADLVWGDGVYIGQNGIAHDCVIDEFTSQGVGRQVVAVAHHTGVGVR